MLNGICWSCLKFADGVEQYDACKMGHALLISVWPLCEALFVNELMVQSLVLRLGIE